MKNHFIVLTSLIFIFVSTSTLFAQWVQTNGPFGGTVTAMVAIPDTQTGGVDIFAATDGGGFYRSSDNGIQWHKVKTDLKKNTTIRCLTVLSNGEGAWTLYAGTTSGLYYTLDGGKTWKSLGALFEDCAVCPVAAYIDASRDTVLLAGVISSLFVSTDAGRNWVSPTTPPVSSPTSFAVMHTMKDSGIIHIVAGTMWDGIYVSSDNGMTWTPSTLKGSIGAVGASDSIIFAGAYADHIYRSTDEGTSWTALSNGLPPATDIKAFAFIPNASGSSSVVAISYGEIFLSTDNGDHWHAIKNNLWAGLFFSLTVAQLNSDIFAIFVGTESGVFRSTNAGLTWDVVNQGLSACIVTSLGVSKSSIFAGTSGNGIFRSRDQGSTWIPVNNGLDSSFIESMQTFGGLKVNSIASFGNTLLAGTLAGIFRSTDDGTTWIDVNNDCTKQQIWSFAKSDSVILAGGSVFFVFRSTDDGMTWSCGDRNFTSGSVMALTSGNGMLFAAAMEGGAYLSTNNGTSWTKIYSPGNSEDAYSLTYVSPYLLLGKGSGGLLRSSDDGKTWRVVGSGLPADCEIYDFVVTGSNVFAGTFGGVFLSTDYGLQWINVSSNELSTAIRSLDIIGSDLIAGTEGAGVIWKRPLSEMIAFTHVSTRLLSFNFKLEQNNPNPFNSSTTISFSLPSKSFVSLVVYDIIGRKVATIISEELPAGNYKRHWNAQGLSSGIYFYRLQAGNFTETKKLVLLQ